LKTLEREIKVNDFKLFDYAICSFGVLGALHNGGFFFGRIIGPFRIVILYISTTIVVYAATSIFFVRFTGHGGEIDRKLYIFHLVTNFLPILATVYSSK